MIINLVNAEMKAKHMVMKKIIVRTLNLFKYRIKSKQQWMEKKSGNY